MISEDSQLVEIDVDVGRPVYSVAFATNDAFVVSGGENGVRVWRAKDGKQMASMETGNLVTVFCLAVSSDGNWIAAGTTYDHVFVWNAKTFEKVSDSDSNSGFTVTAVDFSPDSTKIVSTSGGSTIIWGTWKKALTLYGSSGRAAKFSPQGDCIATADHESVRVWDSSNGRLLVEIKVEVSTYYNNGLVWSYNDLLVISKYKIKKYDATTGTAVTEWLVPDTSDHSCLSLQKHGQVIAYSTDNIVSFWDPSTHAQLGLVQHTQGIRSTTLSHNEQFLAMGGLGKISIQSLSGIIDSPHLNSKRPNAHDDAPLSSSMPSSHLHPTLQDPDVEIDGAVLDSWNHDHLEDTHELLTTAISTSLNPHSHLLPSRALVRARLQLWDEALEDANKAISIQPSVIAFIAKSLAHVGKAERDEAYRSCDIAFEHFHSSHVTFLLLMKAIIVFMAGQRPDAISRVDDIIAMVPFNSVCCTVQAYMHFLIGESKLDGSGYEGAIQSFERARAQMQYHSRSPLSTISLITGWKFDNLGSMIRQRLCDALYASGRTEDAVKRFHELEKESGEDGDHLDWVIDFKRRSSQKLESLGDVAMNAQQYDIAITHYSTALSLVPSPQGILIKRSKALLATGSWKRALDDANQIILLDSSSPCGYEIKHAALHRGGDYDNAIHAFELMLSKMAKSCDRAIQQRHDQYINPSKIRATIRRIVHRILRRLPRVLINTTTGRLHNRAQQVSAFESLPIFKELVSSMTTRIDRARIKCEVREYFRYVMLSHKWEDDEPIFKQVVDMKVYDLEHSPTHDKLQTFCKIVLDAGFNWAWSDTCCIEKTDHFVLQEALVAMFMWYRNAAMVIVFLRGVRSPSPPGSLAASTWNTRAWTLQEYIAARVVRFYAEDWTPYRDLDVPNHKESAEIIAEMEKATRISGQQLMSLRPGLRNIREKMRLASTRETTMVEDAAYSLLGIFSAIGIPAIYGEGQASLGRLLANIITRSGDVSTLAWTGDSSPFNTCLPARITVFNEPETPYFPAPIPDSEIENIISKTPSFNLDVALRLYDRLNKLSTPRFADSRMTLPCIAFQIPAFSSCRTRSGRVYRADTAAFGMIEIKTKHDLSRMRSLYLVHPWMDSLLEHEDTHGGGFSKDHTTPPPSPNMDDEDISDSELDDHESDAHSMSSSFSEPESPSIPVFTQTAPPVDREMGARRLVARLVQPFGALLLRVASTRQRDGAADYKRVAADALITVQFQKSVPLDDILNNVRVLDIL